MMIMQRTLKAVVKAKGISLHSGECTNVTLRPAAANTGIVFRRVDLASPMDIPALALNVQDTVLNTTLIKNGIRVSTVEHLMSAFAGTGVDNAYVDVDTPELPIMDGSAAPFVYLIQSAGIEKQKVAKRFIRIKQEIKVSHGDKWARLVPYDGFRLSFTINFDHPLFQTHSQHAELEFSDATYLKEISRARTFGFMSEFEHLRERGLAKGASLDNAIAIDDYRVLNKDGLRYEDECVKHKILDAVGDLYLLGSHLIGAFEGYKSGHALNNALLRELLARQESWEYVSFDGKISVPASYTGLASASAIS